MKMAFSLNEGKSIYMKISNYCDKKKIQAKHFEYIQFFSNCANEQTSNGVDSCSNDIRCKTQLLVQKIAREFLVNENIQLFADFFKVKASFNVVNSIMAKFSLLVEYKFSNSFVFFYRRIRFCYC